MKFDSSALPLLPTPQQLAELNDLLVSAIELYKIYTTLERHPRIAGSPRSLEIFSACTEQLEQDISVLNEQLETLLSLSRAGSDGIPAQEDSEKSEASAYAGGLEAPDTSLFIPDVEPTDVNKSVFEIVRKSFQVEELFNEQLIACLFSAQVRKHLKLELQLKMIILSTNQRCSLLEERYGFAKSENALFQGLRRQTTRFLSAIHGETRIDIDQ